MTADSAKRPARDRLRPYVSGLALQWLETTPTARHRRVPGSLAFIDISGFTALTERLASKGKVGAEEMSDLLDATFAKLLAEAYGYGASLVKWGGDAVLLLFEDAEHAALAARAAYEMRRTMRQIGRLRTSVGVVQLRMSVGINSGEFDFFMAGERHHELLTGGPAATTTALMEQAAEAGEIVVSRATAELLPSSCLGDVKGDGVLLRSAPKVARRSRAWVPSSEPADPGDFVDPAIRDQLLTEVGDCEHRQVAVGFVEISGVDDLLARQGPGAVGAALHDLIAIVQEECAHHAVTFWETDISADGFKIMLVAGAPRSTGHDEEGMLRATRTILDRYDGPVRVRIGVNCGRVFSGGFGPYFRRTWSVKGDAVNLAARVMGKAQPGTLVATEALLRRVSCTVEAELLPPFMVKGKRHPVRAAVLLAVKAGRADVASATLFAGRRAELDMLLDAVRAANHGTGGGVAITGDPGIGKSRLVDHASSRFADSTLVLRSFADPYESATPYFVVRRLLRAAVRLEPDASEERVIDRIRRLVAREAAHLLPWLPLLVVPFGAELTDTAETRDIQEQFRPARTQSLVVELLSAVLKGTTVFLVDDVHNSDDASAGMVARLATEAKSRRWLVIVVGRSMPPSLDDGTFDERALPALSPDEAETLVLGAPGGERLVPHVVRAIVERGEGNPLFLHALTGATMSSQVEDLPSTIEEILSAQIDALAPMERRLLRATSVLGVRFDEQLVTELLGESPSDFQWQAVAQFLVRHADGSRRFRTTLARDVAYEGLPFRQRVELHGLAASALEARSRIDGDDRAEALSLHCLAAQRYGDAWHYSRLAGDRARRQYANTEALTFQERARVAARKVPGLPAIALAELLESMGDVHARLAEMDAAVAAYREARRLAPDQPALRARAALGIALAATKGAAPSKALRWFSIADRDAGIGSGAEEDGALAVLRGRAMVERAALRYRQSRHAESIALCKHAVEVAQVEGAEFVFGRALHLLDANEVALGRAASGGRLWEALALFERCGDFSWQAAVWNHLGIHAYYESQWSRAVECYERTRELRLRVGDEWGALVGAANVAEILIDQGKHAEGEALAREALRVWRALGTPGDIGFAATLMARACAWDGRFVEAAGFLDEALTNYTASGAAIAAAETRLQAADLSILQGQPGTARTSLDEAITALTKALTVANGSNGAERVTALDVRLNCAQSAYILRLEGYIEGQLGKSAEARSSFESSLSVARDRESLRDTALAMDGLVWLDRDDDLARERDHIFDQLGILGSPAVPLALEPAHISLPEPRTTTDSSPRFPAG